MKRFILSFMLVALLASTGCKTVETKEKYYNASLFPVEDALVKITDPSQIPDFTKACSNLYSLEEAVNNSLNYLGKPSSETFFPMQGISHAKVRESLELFRDIIRMGYPPEKMSEQIKQSFDVYMSVGCDKQGTVLFTGYYTPIFDGSFDRTEQFKYPLYKMPENLVKSETGETLGIKTAGGSIEPLPARAELEGSGILAGQELIYLEDPFEVYIAHVQGSAKIRLPDDRLITVGYAATNGYEYKPIATSLSTASGIPMSKMSLKAMIEYFSVHKDEVPRFINQNPRFVFFREAKGNPTGSINEPVIAMRSIATDKTIFPRAALTFIDTALPRDVANTVVIYPYKGFMLDQDTGGAIRAAGRCDVYMGQGDSAGEVAGKTYEEGKLYYLIAK